MLGKQEDNPDNALQNFKFSVHNIGAAIESKFTEAAKAWRSKLECFIRERAKGTTAKAAHVCCVQTVHCLMTHKALAEGTTVTTAIDAIFPEPDAIWGTTSPATRL